MFLILIFYGFCEKVKLLFVKLFIFLWINVRKVVFFFGLFGDGFGGGLFLGDSDSDSNSCERWGNFLEKGGISFEKFIEFDNGNLNVM